MANLNDIGSDFILEEINNITDEIIHVTPSVYAENTRYLPKSVSSLPGPFNFDINPFMREIVDCFDIASPVREVAVMKGVQITYTTALESVMLYAMGHVKTSPVLYMTADKELATARIENNVIPMLNHSNMGHIIRSSDTGNSRKSGKTKDHLQWEGGGYLLPFGAKNADKMRSFSILFNLQDEIDAFPLIVGKDGDPVKLADSRCKGFWETRKILRGSTPLIKGTSKIERAYLNGDQRKYFVKCQNPDCEHKQFLEWKGFKWDMDDNNKLIIESVRYECSECGHEHYEHNKEKLFSAKHGAEWIPTATATMPGVRSYHLPAFYSPIGMAPWYSLIADYLECFDPISKKIKDIGQYQTFINNVKAETFEILGSKVNFQAVSAHRRSCYLLGTVPNKHALQFSESRILFLTCTVDVHKDFLAVKIMGVAKGFRTYVIDYIWIETEHKDEDFNDIDCPGWRDLREIIEETKYISDDGCEYGITVTLIDSGYANSTVVKFCHQYISGVYPILGRDRPAKAATIKEFSKIETVAGTVGYKIVVDHYKDRIAPALRREWIEEDGLQPTYHFNAPLNITDKSLKELTKEYRREKKDPKGITSYEWYRPGNARNELWDLTVYAHAAVEIFAWNLCVEQFELETIEWDHFWAYLEENKLYIEQETV